MWLGFGSNKYICKLPRLTIAREEDAVTECPAPECPANRVPTRLSAQRSSARATEYPADRVPNGHRVPSDPKSIQIKPKGGRKLLPPVRWSLKRKFGLHFF